MIEKIRQIALDSETADSIINWDWDFFLEPYFDLLGPIFPAIAAIFLVGISFIWTRNMALPTVLMVLLGGGMVTYLPAAAQSVGLLLVFAGLVSAIWIAISGNGRRMR